MGVLAEGARIRIAQADADGWAPVHRGFRKVGYVRALPRNVRVDGTAESPSFALWLIGGVALIGAFVLGTRSRFVTEPGPIAPAPPPAGEDVTLAVPAPEVTAHMTAPAPAPAATPEQKPESQAEQNGREFEEWAARRLSKAPFHLMEWRGDKYVDGVYAESTLAPDLVVEYRDRGHRIRFAVECKWRRRYWEDGLRWGEHKHLARYNRYAADQQIPVYLLLGVGGTGGEPSEVFLVPLKDARYPVLFARELTKFDRVERDGRFDVDDANGWLRLLPLNA